jgi:hypothetical protein
VLRAVLWGWDFLISKLASLELIGAHANATTTFTGATQQGRRPFRFFMRGLAMPAVGHGVFGPRSEPSGNKSSRAPARTPFSKKLRDLKTWRERRDLNPRPPA